MFSVVENGSSPIVVMIAFMVLIPCVSRIERMPDSFGTKEIGRSITPEITIAKERVITQTFESKK